MYLGIDYGKKRIGMAVGSRFPEGIGVIVNPDSFDILVDSIKRVCLEYDIEKIVLGYPMPSSGEVTELGKEINELKIFLEQKINIEVILEQEDYTSVAAEAELKKRGVNTRKNKGDIDELAAVLILEQYIDRVK